MSTQAVKASPAAKQARYAKAAVTRRASRLAADRKRAEAAGFQARGEHDWVPVEDLFSDPRYQRSVDQRRVEKMAAEFDPDALGVIYVSDRGNGTFAVMDGFHRVALMRHLGWGDQKMPAFVFNGLKVAEEAEIFTKMNKNRRAPHPIDLFRSEVTAGRPNAVGLNEVFTEAGVVVSKTGAGTLRAVATAQKVFSIAGPDVLRRTLKILGRAWERHDDVYSGDVVSGLALLIYAESSIDDKHMADRLSDFTPAMVINKAQAAKEVLEGKTPPAAMAHILTGIYNTRRRSRRLGVFMYQGWPKKTATGLVYGHGWSDERGEGDEVDEES